ncbi:SDR family NAD(P)-dependent oxidoreductase [Nostocaceae cyanobacterium CENA369]|uniref:Phenolphthiocerol/phthiocerol polyketide synthase subunit E n=1 Tax=Dendronalium phyllosphericum CENA369 TaxID=1725256 RepID=A0A8J7LDJ6_9NOST|nr:type I polyketide synthase [Dendronalium phyllosphericum]MBH8571744.1 SDR family NAD(P)-dependent oxidoreductase [Dendronalium phyllosphericum CENA369]
MNNDKNYELIEGVAIIGMAGRFPGAISIESFWQNLQDGVESLSLFTDEELIAAGVPGALVNDSNYVKVGGVLEDIDLFDAAFFDLNPKEAEVTDPQHRLFLECAWSALENAGYDSTKCESRIGVYAGASLNNYLAFDLKKDQLGSGESYQKLIGNDKGFLSTRVSYKLNLTGPSITVQTACSTSLVATTLAYQSLQNYQCDMALAGGVSIRLPQKTGYFYEPGGPLSPDGHCHAFDAKAQGTTVGNGVGVVVLKRVKDAIADGDCIYAVIKGAAINNDGSMKVGYTAPSVDGQAEAIAEAIMLAEVEPETISYIEAHGSGTALGDPIEIAALTKVFRANTEKKNFCAIGSVKTNIGHLDAAAGVAGLIKTALALKHQLIPPSLNFEQPNPEIDFANSPFYVNTNLKEWKGSTPRRAGISSLGMGGTNTHVVLEEAPTLPASSPSRPWQLLVLSAKTESALATATQNLSQHLTLHSDINLADVAYTLQVGRRDFSHRRILVCSNVQDAIQALNQPASQQAVTQFQESGTRSVAFIFPGVDALYADMGRELYETESVFRAQVERCCLILKPHLDLDLRSVIYKSESEEETAVEIQHTGFAESALFVIEYALAQLWMSWGISPQAMIGQGVGEYVAATLAGVFSLEDALVLVAKSSTKLLEKVQLNPPKIPFISNVSGTWITQAEATNPNYWTQIQQPKLFNKGIAELLKDKQRILLEVGFRETLSHAELTIPYPHEQHSEVAFLLNTLGRLWMLGIKIDWSSFYANERRYRLPLPTYPFERQRYWIESTTSQKSLVQIPAVENQRYSIELDSSTSETASQQSLDKKPNIADWFYIPVWKQSMPLEFFQEELSQQKLYCLVFVDNYGVGTEFVERLKQQNQDIIIVRLGEQFSKLDDQIYCINPQQPDDYDALLKELQKQNFKLNTIAHFWSVTPSDISLKNQDWDLSFYSLLFLAQAIGKQDIWDSLKLMVVTSNLHDVTGDENLYPQKATILGPCKVIPKEYRSINCSLVDLVMDSAQSSISSKSIDKLVAELTLKQTDEIVAYRGYHRWVQTFDAVSLENSIANKTKLRKGGVYLITGGLGGIGLVLAEHLAKTFQAKLILISRKGLPERSEWEQWLVVHNSQDAISRQIQKVRSLLQLGAQIEVISADVTNSAQMQAVITQALQKFGEINGVIHAAGIPGGGVTQLKTRDMASNVLAAKVQGTLVLEEVFKDINLDFFVLCSSKTSILGEFGQIDYCAANAFLDAYARCNYRRDRLTVSISWDTWQEVGFAVETVLPDKIQQERTEIIKKGILSQEGIDVFNRVLGSKLPHVVVSTQDLPALIQQNNSPQYLQEQLSSVNLSKAKHSRPNLGNDYIAPETEIEEILADIWQEILGIDKIGIYDNFFELGGNSINTIQIAAKANQAGLKLTSQQFFHYQTIAELATDLSITLTIQPELNITPIQDSFLEQNQSDLHPINQSLLLEIQRVCDDQKLLENIEDIYELTPVQKGMLFHCLFDSELSLYFFQHIFTLHGDLNIEAFKKAWQLVMDRHPILRTRFYWEEVKNPLQIVYKQVEVPLNYYDWSNINSVEQKAQLDSFIVSDRQKSFDFSQPCLMRHTLIRFTDDKYLYIWSFNHIIIDGWGGSLVFQEFVETYGTLCQDKQTSFAPTRPFREYIDWLQQQDISKAENFWRQALQGVKTPTSLTYIEKLEKIERSSTQEVRYSEEIIQLSPTTTEALQTFATQHRLTLATIINGIWAVLLSRYTCCHNILYGCTVTGRPADLQGVESMVGMFVNTLPIHVNIDTEQLFLSWLQRFQLQLVEVRDYEYTPLTEIHKWSEIPQKLTLFESIVVVENFPVSEFIRDWQGNIEFQHTEIYYRNNYPLNLVVYPNKELLIAISYDSRRFETTTIAGILKDIEMLLQGLINNHNFQIKNLPLLTPEQQQNAAFLNKELSFNWSFTSWS